MYKNSMKKYNFVQVIDPEGKESKLYPIMALYPAYGGITVNFKMGKYSASYPGMKRESGDVFVCIWGNSSYKLRLFA